MTLTTLLPYRGIPLAALFLACSACGDPGGTPDTDGGLPMPGDLGPLDDASADAQVTPELEASLTRDALRIVQGESATVRISVLREGAVGPVVVAPTGELPDGVALTPVTVPSGIDEVPLVLEVTGAAPQGGPFSVELEVSATDSPIEPVVVSLSLTIAGAPGTLDESFGDGGIAVTDLGDSFYHPAMTVDSVGRIVVTGRTPYLHGLGEPLTMVVRRIARDGELDRSFGARGTFRYTGEFGTEGTSLVVSENDGVRAVGARWQDEWGMAVDRFVVSLDRFGSISGGSGETPIPGFTSGSSLVFSTSMGDELVVYSGAQIGALRSDGSFDRWTLPESPREAGSCVGTTEAVTCGLTYRSTEEVPLIARLDRDGAADASFGRDGLLEWPNPQEARERVFARALSLRSDGSGYAFVVHQNATQSLNELVRFGEDGVLDVTFGSGGHVNLGEDPVWVADTLVDGAGRLVVLGRFGPSGDQASEIRRYTIAGNLDPSFGTGGVIDLEALTVSDLGLIEHIEAGDRLVGCDTWDEDGILRCFRVWL